MNSYHSFPVRPVPYRSSRCIWLFLFCLPRSRRLSGDNGMPVVGGHVLPFLPRVSVITFSYFIYPFIGYADFYLSLYVRLLHVILKVVVFFPRASNINQPKALIGGEAYHIDTYEQMAIRLAGPIESPLGSGKHSISGGAGM